MACGLRLAFLLSLYLLLSCTAAWTGGRCGPASGGAICSDFQCCDRDGQCGLDASHCGTDCQTSFGMCNPSSSHIASMDYMINILVAEPGETGLPTPVNTTGLAGVSPGSLWGTMPFDEVFDLCETFAGAGNHSVAVNISSGSYSLAADMSVQAAAGCGAEDEDTPPQALLLDTLRREFLVVCHGEEPTSCLVYAAGEGQQYLRTLGFGSLSRVHRPLQGTDKSAGAPIACGPYYGYYVCPEPLCCNGMYCSLDYCGTPGCLPQYSESGCNVLCGYFASVGEVHCISSCCSSQGICGSDSQSCGYGCQSAHGHCNAPQSPTPSPPKPGPSPPYHDDYHATVSRGKVRIGIIVGPGLGGLLLLVVFVVVVVVLLKRQKPEEPVRVHVGT